MQVMASDAINCSLIDAKSDLGFNAFPSRAITAAVMGHR